MSVQADAVNEGSGRRAADRIGALSWLTLGAACSGALLGVAMWGVNTSERAQAAETFAEAQAVRDHEQDERMTRVEMRLIAAVESIKDELHPPCRPISQEEDIQ